MKWKTTSKTLPPEGSTVLGYWAPGVPGGNDCYGVVTYAPPLWHDPENDEDDFRPPDYWMGLPTPPIAARDEGKT